MEIFSVLCPNRSFDTNDSNIRTSIVQGWSLKNGCIQ